MTELGKGSGEGDSEGGCGRLGEIHFTGGRHCQVMPGHLDMCLVPLNVAEMVVFIRLSQSQWFPAVSSPHLDLIVVWF